MTRDNHTRRRDVRAYMAKHGVTYTQALRAINAPTAPLEPFPPHTCLPRVLVDPAEVNDKPQGQVDGWGRIERLHDNWLITPTDYGHAIQAGRTQLLRVDYRDPRTGEPAAVEVPAVVHRQYTGRLGTATGRWVWAANGWAVDEPGEIADQAPTPAPSPELPYEVRAFSLINAHGTFPLDWNGSAPNWYTLAWCPTLQDAAEIARRAMAYTSINHHGRIRVWGPSLDDPAERQVVLTVDPPATPGPTLPHLPFGKLPATPRPDSPAPESEPAWVDSSVVDPRDRPRYSLRVWNPADGWRGVSWSSCRQYAAIVAGLLCIGVDEHPWPYGEVWGPGWRHGDAPRVMMDYEPDMTFQEKVVRWG
jgi:hypothetical protein